MRRLAILTCALASVLGAQVKDISGTWIAKVPSPMGEMEIVYRLHVDSSGNITGSQTLRSAIGPGSRA